MIWNIRWCYSRVKSSMVLQFWEFAEFWMLKSWDFENWSLGILSVECSKSWKSGGSRVWKFEASMTENSRILKSKNLKKPRNFRILKFQNFSVWIFENSQILFKVRELKILWFKSQCLGQDSSNKNLNQKSQSPEPWDLKVWD